MVPRHYKFCLHKSYFDQGYGLTNYFKFLIALVGVSTLNVRLTLAIGFVYLPCCYVLGWAWYHYGFQKANIEVQNKFNIFVKEMRKVYKGK